jgi:Flp pilus assembly protein TadG
MARFNAMEPMTTALGSRLQARCRRFARAQGGAAVVEFALMSVPFFLLLFGIIELSLIFLLSTTMDNAASEVARTVRTGELQLKGGATAQTFKTAICDTLGWLKGDCTKNLYVEVRTFDTFQLAGQAPSPVDNGQFKPDNFQFQLGQPGSIEVVRAYYKWPFITPMVGKAMHQLKDGSMVLMSTVTFRNEPYSTGN